MDCHSVAKPDYGFTLCAPRAEGSDLSMTRSCPGRALSLAVIVTLAELLFVGWVVLRALGHL